MTPLLNNHLTKNNLITPNQWAYRKAHCTELLLIHLTEKWRRFVDGGFTVTVALVDFGKVFDCVPHLCHLEKLNSQFGIEGPLYACLESYLSNLKQFTVIKWQRIFKTTCQVWSSTGLGSWTYSVYVVYK